LKKKFINIHIKILEEDYDLLYAIFFGLPFSGIEERLDEVIATFPLDYWNSDESLIKSAIVSSGLKADIVKEEIIEDKNWNEEWEKNVPSIKVNDRIGIAPEWKLNELDTSIKIAINPKMSFGTGEHCSTRLICILAEKIIHKDSFWIDAGTGTGVLAILAIKLGAGRVLAFDNNYWSIDNASENLNINKVITKIELIEADIDSFEFPDCDGIMANLFFNLLMPSFPKFYNGLKNNKGDLLVSGILIYNKDEIIKSATDAGFELVKFITEDEWIAIHFKAI
jgi:ribosomal protein L11 methyltransferase